MPRTSRSLSLSVLAVSAALVAGCGTVPDTEGLGSGASTAPTVTSTAGSPSPSAQATVSATPTSTLPPGVDQLIALTVRSGKVTGAARLVPVKKGSVVRLVVTSDVTDEIHLHTYDKSVGIAAGKSAALTFRASIAGTFEVELEKRGLRLTRLRVT